MKHRCIFSTFFLNFFWCNLAIANEKVVMIEFLSLLLICNAAMGYVSVNTVQHFSKILSPIIKRKAWANLVAYVAQID